MEKLKLRNLFHKQFKNPERKDFLEKICLHWKEEYSRK
jgi:hypothetical protein